MQIDQGLIDVAWYGVVIISLALLLAIGLWMFRMVTSMTNVPFFSGRDKRLGIIEQTAIDGRRRLVLIRRDGVEHLVMTGGPIDLVVESGIGRHRDQPSLREHPLNGAPGSDERIQIAGDHDTAQTQHS